MKQKTERKYRFNFIDVILILLILASVASVVYFVFFEGRVNEKVEKEKVEIEYTLRIEGIDADIEPLKKLANYDAVYDPKTMEKIGDIIGINHPDSKYYYFDSVSQQIKTEKNENLIDLEITVRATAEKDTDGTYRVGTERLAVGSRIVFRTKLFEEESVCVAFNEIDNR